MPVQKVTKEEILLRASDVFRTKGYHNTSMQDIAQSCGLLKGSLYHHFPSKEMLMKDLLFSINNYMKDIPAIGNAFQQLTALPDIDAQGYCVEWYLNDKDVKCMVRIAD